MEPDRPSTAIVLLCLLSTASCNREAGTAPSSATPGSGEARLQPCRTGEERLVKGIAFVRICPGTFTMGAVDDAPKPDYSNERPAHEVTLSEYWIGKHEITYRHFAGGTDDPFLGDLPASYVSWNSAKTACEHLGGRLPTEAEWEYAARAGHARSPRFLKSEESLGEHAWFLGNSDRKTHPIGTKKPNLWGLHDMHGNVTEWTLDWFAPYSSRPVIDPAGPSKGTTKALRGGSFLSSSALISVSRRFGRPVDVRQSNFGFRCVVGSRRQPSPISEPPASPPPDSVSEAVVRIFSSRGGMRTWGSGFVVGLDEDTASIVTAAGLIEGADVEASFAADPSKRFSAPEILGIQTGDPDGLAVIRIRGAIPTGVGSLSLESEVFPQFGEPLSLLGFPTPGSTPVARLKSSGDTDGDAFLLSLPAGTGFTGAPVLRNAAVVGVVVSDDGEFTRAVRAPALRKLLLGWGVRHERWKMRVVPILDLNSKVAGDIECDSGERTVRGIVFVRICAGTFTMGVDRVEQRDATITLLHTDNRPAHAVMLSEFWIAQTETTNEQYRAFRPDHLGEDDLPVGDVTWAEAQAACEHLGARLPTEAEWEHAARSHRKGGFDWSFDEYEAGDFAWYNGSSNYEPHPVATKKPNSWGLYDLHGNVWEWVLDRYGPYPATPQKDPTGPARGWGRGARGGSFIDPPWHLRATDRYYFLENQKYRKLGFRCVWEPRPPS